MRRRYIAPASVSAKVRLVRLNSVTPRWVSNSPMIRETEAGDRPDWRAASEKLPYRAVAANSSMPCSRFIPASPIFSKSE